MGVSGVKNFLLGIVFLVLGFLVKGPLLSVDAGLFYYIILIVSGCLMIYGALQYFLVRLQGGSSAEGSQETLAKEALLKTLAVMTQADTNIKTEEVQAVTAIYGEITGDMVSAADVRVAARSDLTEDKSHIQYLTDIEHRLSHDDKIVIMRALVRIARADANVSVGEGNFFNDVAKALQLSATDIASLSHP